MPLFSLDFQSRLPIYEQLYQNVVRMAALGVLQPGEQLPTVRSLARELGVNPNTVQKAYQMLERDGILNSVTGRGSYIAENLSAVEQRRKDACQRLCQAVDEAVNAGVDKQQILSLVQSRLSEENAANHGG